MKEKSIGNLFKGDKVIWMVFFFLCMISIVEVYSASSSLSYKGGNFWSPIIYHVTILFFGTFAILCVLNVPCKYFKLITPILIFLSLITLLWVLVAGHSTNGASRWLSFLGIQFQPSEIAKGTVILAVAQILSAMQTPNGADKKAIKYILLISFVLIGPIALENLSTAALLFAVVMMMMFIGHVPRRQMLKLIGGIGAFVAFVLVMVLLVGNADNTKVQDSKDKLTEQTAAEPKKQTGIFDKIFHRADTWKARLENFFDTEEVRPEDYDLDKDAQVAHANIAIASSNIVGKGPGNSEERDFLSQAFSDFIYAIIIEEMGIEGAVVVLFLYIVLLFRAGKIAGRCENAFPAFLIMGLALLLVTQALFNMCVAVGLAPVTGQPLPLISKGGTSSIINCIYMGAMLSVSRSAKKKPQKDDKSVKPQVQMA